MTTTLSESLQKSLALGIACGQSVRSWAKRHAVDCEATYEWSIQKECRELVELTRLRVADRMVGKLIRGVRLAIDQLVKMCTRSKSEAIRLSACRVLLTHWVPISRHFTVKGKMRLLEETIESWEKKTQSAPKTGPWHPPAPYA
jgi:hypothetical protein